MKGPRSLPWFRLGSSLVAVVMLVGLSLGVNLRAQAQSGNATLSAGSGSGQPGQSNVTISVGFSSTTDVSGVNFDFGFDSSRLTVTSVTGGSAADGKSLSWSTPSSGTVRVIVFGLDQAAIPDGTLVNVTFAVKSSAPAGTFPLTISNAAASAPDGSSVPVNTNGGSFDVIAPTSLPTSTQAPTNTPLPTATATQLPPTHTPTPTSSSGSTATPLPSPTRTATQTFGTTATLTNTPSQTVTGDSLTPSAAATGTGTPEATSAVLTTTEPAAATRTALADGERALEAAVAATATALGAAAGPVTDPPFQDPGPALAATKFLRSPTGIALMLIGGATGLGLLVWVFLALRAGEAQAGSTAIAQRLHDQFVNRK